MYIVTSNEKNDLTSWERRQDVLDIYDGLPSQPIVLWQEIKQPEHHTDIKAKVPTGTHHAFPELPIPISVPARFDVLDERAVQTKVWTGNTIGPVGDNPRYYGVLRLKDTNTPTLPEFYVINTHFTNGCEWDSVTPTSTAEALRPYWTDHWDLLKIEIDGIKNQDYTVFYGGDFNRKNSPPFGTAERLAVGDGRVDKLAVINRSVSSTLKDTGIIQTFSDHNAHWAKWDLFKRS